MEISRVTNTPITDESPGGENIRYDPEFEELQKEIDKLSSPTKTGELDWHKVEHLGLKILTQKSKDLLVAAYVAVAILKNHREEGLVQGIRLICDLLRNFWDVMFPPRKRIKGRIQAIEWWIDKTESAVKSLAPLHFSASTYDSILDDLAELDNFLKKHIDDAPSLSSLKIVLEEASEVEKRSESQASTEKSATTTFQRPLPTNQGLGLNSIYNLEDFKKGIASVLSALKKLAFFLRENHIHDPLCYRLWRAAVWLPITDLPPSEQGRTKIAPPQSQIISSFEALKSAGDWVSLIKASESRLAEFPFWLDLNHQTMLALNAMGEEFSKAAFVVEKETFFFVSLFENLTALSFSDGTPFANQETIKWLGAISSTKGDASVVSNSDVVGPEDGDIELEKLCKEAQTTAYSGDDLKTARLLQKGLDQSKSGRNRFNLLVCLIELLKSSKNSHILFGLCDEILESIEKYHIDEWEPDLAFRGLKAVWHCFSGSKVMEKKRIANEIMMRMARIDMAKTLDIMNKKIQGGP